jgi:osmotically-inducible protein OsmY
MTSHGPDSPPAVAGEGEAEQVRRRVEALLGGSYWALRRVSCEYSDGLLTLRGRLPSYYFKQVAQEMAARVPGVGHVENRIEVVPGEGS